VNFFILNYNRIHIYETQDLCQSSETLIIMRSGRFAVPHARFPLANCTVIRTTVRFLLRSGQDTGQKKAAGTAFKNEKKPAGLTKRFGGRNASSHPKRRIHAFMPLCFSYLFFFLQIFSSCASAINSSLKSGCAMEINASARCQDDMPFKLTLPYSVTT